MNGPINILLVEDNPADVRLTEEALKDIDIDFQLTVAGDGEAAIKILRSYPSPKHLPQVIFLDLNMPKKNGHEVLSEIKQDKGLQDIPVVVLTVSQDEEDVIKAMNLKMNYYLNKPVNTKNLSAVLPIIDGLWN